MRMAKGRGQAGLVVVGDGSQCIICNGVHVRTAARRALGILSLAALSRQMDQSLATCKGDFEG